MMNRLYTSFPSSHSGFGLFLLRSLTGGSLLMHSCQLLFALLAAPGPRNELLIEAVIASALLGSVFMIAGLWTSIAATFGLISGLAYACLALGAPRSLFLALLSVVVALLGPGAWSLDARLFGWRQIRFAGPKPRPEET